MQSTSANRLEHSEDRPRSRVVLLPRRRVAVVVPLTVTCPRCHRAASRLLELEQLFLEGYVALVACDRCLAALRASPDPMTIVSVVGEIEP